MSEPATTTRRPGRPRSERARLAILQAAADLLLDEGTAQVSMDAVAERAGVSKATIYRWWPSKAPLVEDALLRSRVLQLDLPDTGNLRDDLIALVTRMVALVGDPESQSLARSALLAAAAHPELASLGQVFFADRLHRERTAFDKARDRGELPPAVDPKLIMDLLGGAVWLRLFFRQEQVGPDFARDVVDVVLAGVRAVERPG